MFASHRRATDERTARAGSGVARGAGVGAGGAGLPAAGGRRDRRPGLLPAAVLLPAAGVRVRGVRRAAAAGVRRPVAAARGDRPAGPDDLPAPARDAAPAGRAGRDPAAGRDADPGPGTAGNVTLRA